MFACRTRLPALASLLVCAACGGEEPRDPHVPAYGAVPPTDDLSVLDELAAVGYVDFSDPDGEEGSGVVLRAPEAAPGYTLVTSLPHGLATLVDLEGRTRAVFRDPERTDERWSRVRLLANGDALVLSPKDDELVRLSFTGELRWRLALEIHHDGVELPDGRLLLLTRRFRDLPKVDPERRSVDNSLAFVSGDGRLLEEHSLYDLLEAEPRLLEVVRPEGLEGLPAGYTLDPIHANTVFWIRDELPGHPYFRPGRVLVTIRYLDSVALFDLEERRCVWAWGAGVLEGPHDASVLPNGNVLVLDNGYEPRGWSRVVEYDPRKQAIVWEYRSSEPERFHTSGRGTVQRLANDHVLVGNSNSGEAFEVTRDGKIVWRFLNPLRDEKGARGVIRVERYPPETVESWLVK